MTDFDDAVLDLLRAIGTGEAPLPVFDGETVPTSENDDKVIVAPVPYLVAFFNLGDEAGRRLDGFPSQLNPSFQVTYVGGTREQAKWAGRKQRAALRGVRLDLGDGKRSWMVRCIDSQLITRDRNARRAGNEPLFYGVDRYESTITQQPAQP